MSDSKTYKIRLEHITRVEGHGSILIDTNKGKVEEVRLEIVEANRFFENLVKGMQPHEVVQTVSRICGICCVGHQLAALKAVEAAMGVTVSDQTVRLRKMLNESQFLQSHTLHLYFLALPDYFGAPSILPLAQREPELVKRALALKKMANDYTAVFGGRALHPVANTVNGWRKLPDLAKVEEIHTRLRQSVPEMEMMLELIKTLPVPEYERETEYVSLKHPDEYALYDGEVYGSATGTAVPVSDYRQVTNEFTVAHSTSKWSRWHRDSYMVGALARVNNNFKQLHPKAQEAADALGLKTPCYNPYHNNTAQMVEIVHCTHNSLAMLEDLLNRGLVEEEASYTPVAGRGCGATEVPRGILFHEYGFDGDGRCLDANAIIPTSQNINNIEQDMKAFVPAMLPVMGQEELSLKMEMLLRAYDPCISCSVHMLDVRFV
ncbi:MAG: Ni/Fe hydrogenase subunit alpha [Desulfobulbaceae bacterium]|nr:Ni/Fe hydrogenase subunit alpha [Desulfobulbaceae bacterium]